MPKLFRLPYTIALYDTDAAALIFYANLFRITQYTFEALMKDIGFGLLRLFAERTVNLPIVHVEGDFEKPLRIGMPVEVRAFVENIGSSSFRISYELWSETEGRMARAATVQVCIDPKTGRSMELPPDFRKALESYS